MDKWTKVKYLASGLPPRAAIGVYSLGRQVFLSGIRNENPRRVYTPPEDLSRTLWGIKFRTPLFNAAGAFKDFNYYNLAFKQGAGAYLVGTITPNPRDGNEIDGILHPLAMYPRSHASSNSLGLPNQGIEKTLEDISGIERHEGFPIGISLASDSLGELVQSMQLCEEKGIDFIQLNESCPNVENAGNLTERLGYVDKNFLKKRKRHLPVEVKFSNDLNFTQIPDVVDLLLELNYDGINLGNTSTDYHGMRNKIHPRELALYDFYTKNFRGGLSGNPLKEVSLALASVAVEYVKACSPHQEFHVTRTGGIETREDISDSKNAGVSLNGWYTGHFRNLDEHGNDLYRNMFEPAA